MMDGLEPWKVMVEAPRRLPTIKGHSTGENVRWCTRCSLSEDHEPVPPSSGPAKGSDGKLVIIGPYPEAWSTGEVERLIRLMQVSEPVLQLSAIYCQVEGASDAQRGQCQLHVETFMRLASQPIVVVVGRMAPVSLGFDSRAHLAGRVGIWHDPNEEGAGCFCLFVDAPDGHNSHRVLDQLYPLPKMLNGDMSLMKLIGAGNCAFGECTEHTFMLDKTGIPWCKKHQWGGGVNDGRVVKKKKSTPKKGK